jgi:hypothetical protein
MIRNVFYKTSLAGVLLLSGFSTSLYAQQTKDYGVKRIQLSRSSEPATQNSPVDVILSGIRDTSCIGYIIKTDDVVEKLVPDTSLEYWLQSYVHQKYKQLTVNDPHLLLEIDELRMQTAENIGYVKLKAKVFTSPAREESYRLIRIVDTVLQLNVSTPEEYVTTAVDLLTDKQQQLKGGIIGKQSIKDDASSRKNLSILKNTQYKSGIYNSFKDFINNKPSVSNVTILPDETTGKIKLYVVSADSLQTEVKQLWGFSLDNELYYYNNGDIVPIEQSGSGFVLSAYMNPEGRSNQAMIRRNLIGRMSKLNDKDKVVYRHDVKAPQPGIIATCIDLDNGELSL